MHELKLLSTIQNLTDVGFQNYEIAEMLKINPSTLSRYKKKDDRNIKPKELFSIEKALAIKGYCIDFQNNNILKKLNDDYDCIELEYIGISPSCGSGVMVWDEPEIKPIKINNTLITDILKCTHPKNLKVFKAQGDSMETLIEDSDLLLVDIGRTDVYNGGIYVFSQDNEWRAKRFRMRIDKVLEIISDNSKYDIELIQPNSDVDLKIRGKVIKNLSRGL